MIAFSPANAENDTWKEFFGNAYSSSSISDMWDI